MAGKCFLQRASHDSMYILWAKKFVEITTSHHFQDKCIFLLYTEMQDVRQKWWETIFGKNCQTTAYTLRAKILVQIVLSYTLSKRNAFLRFTQKFKMDAKNGRKTIFGKKCHMTSYTLEAKICPKLLYLSAFPRNVFLHFTQKFKMDTKNGGK